MSSKREQNRRLVEQGAGVKDVHGEENDTS